MSEGRREHRLEGLEPDNVLAFLALLGLLRALEFARPAWRPRAGWAGGPLRPVLHLGDAEAPAAVVEAAAEGVADLARDHVFDRPTLAFTREEARARLHGAARPADAHERQGAALWSALLSDAAMRPGAEIVERTPFCLLDVAQTAFLKALQQVADPACAPRQGRRALSSAEALDAALFRPWARAHQKSAAFRWDPAEDSRHAHRWAAPTDDKQGVEHGANLLAAVGLRSLTVAPRRTGDAVRLAVRGGPRRGPFSFAWPIWTDPASLTTLEAWLAHPDLRTPGALAHLGVREVRISEKFNPNGGKYSNFGRGRILES